LSNNDNVLCNNDSNDDNNDSNNDKVLCINKSNNDNNNDNT